MKIINSLKGYNKVKEFLEGELNDYSSFKFEEIEWNDYFGDYDYEDAEEHFKVNITLNAKTKTLYFNYSQEEDELSIEVSEDNWEVVKDYDWRIKYFWMTLLNWELE